MLVFTMLVEGNTISASPRTTATPKAPVRRALGRLGLTLVLLGGMLWLEPHALPAGIVLLSLWAGSAD
jgi:hypothetical protein